MAVTTKKLILTLSALALLAGCDDNSGTDTSSNLLDWFQPDPVVTASVYNPQRDYVQDTQAGNYLAGQFAQYRQDWSTASDYFDRVMERDPANIELQQRSMILAIQSGDANRAIALARKVMDQDKSNVLALTLVATEQLSRQDYAGVEATLNKMEENGITNFIKPMMLAWVKAPEGAHDDSALIDASPLHAYHALLIADYTGKIKDGNRYFANILASGEIDSHVMEKVGDVFARHDNVDLARKIYDTILQHKIQNGASNDELQVLKAKLEDPKAHAGPKIATPIQGMAEGFYNMAHILFQDGNAESALVFARISEYLAPASEDNKILLAGIMMQSNHANEAIEILKTLKSGNPAYVQAQRSAAELMEEGGKLDEAIAYLEQIYAEHKDVNALIQIGDAYRRADKHDLAIKAYDRAEAALGGKVPAEYWQLLYARGMSYERSGNLSRAENDLTKAIEYKPDHPYLLNYLGYSWADQGKHMQKAMELIAKAASLRPDDGYITDSLGWVYYKTGSYARAVSELEKAVELVPFDPTINDHLGDAYWHVGRKQEARFQWLRAMNHNEDDEVLNQALQAKLDNGLHDSAPSVLQAKKEIVPAAPLKQ